jgi:PAS domain-containing protein
MAATSSGASEDASSLAATIVMTMITRRDIIPIVLSVIIIILGLVACLTSYFLLAAKEAYDIQNALNDGTTKSLDQIQSAFSQVKLTVDFISTHFASSHSPNAITYQQFLKFIYNEDGLFPPYIYTVEYAPAIPFSQRDSFIASQQAKKGFYTNYTIYSLDDQFNKHVNYYADIYFPITLAAPIGNENSFGIDQLSLAIKKDLIMRSNITNHSILSKKTLYQVGKWGNLLAYTIRDYDTNALAGSLIASIDVSNVVMDAVGHQLLSDKIVVSLYSMNQTTNVGGDYAYSSLPGATEQNVASAIASAQFRAEGTVLLSNSLFRVVLSSMDSYITEHSSFNKYIGVIISVTATVILLGACVVLLFASRLVHTVKSREKHRKRLKALQETYTATSLLLERLIIQDSTMRTCMNCIPEFIIMINRTGSIVHTNRAFDKVFRYSESRLEQGLSVSWLFPSLASNFYQGSKGNTDQDEIVIETVAVTSEEADVEAIITVRCLLAELSDGIVVQARNEAKTDEEQAYVIIGSVKPPKVDMEVGIIEHDDVTDEQ